MPNTYSWEIEDMVVDPLEDGLVNVVKRIPCFLVADDGAGHTTKQLLVASLGPPDPMNFIPFDDITLLDATGWVEDALGTPSVDAWKATLDERLAQWDYTSLPCPWD